MANNKKNINELVTDDDDPTAELEALVLPVLDMEMVHDSAAIADLKSDLTSRSEAISQLQFDIDQLRAKALGLDVEIQAREQVSIQLHTELDDLKDSLKRKNALVKKRDRQIKVLRAEIRERNGAYFRLQEQFDSLNRHRAVNDTDKPQEEAQVLARQVGQLATSELAIRELQQRYLRLEEYADQLRQQIQDRDSQAGSDKKSLGILQLRLHEANDRCAALQNNLAEVKAKNTLLTEELASLQASQADEIRMIRFELGEAQETLTQRQLLTEQLTSDLVETQTYRIELQSMLSETEEISQSRIEKLENENASLQRELGDLREKLETKNEAISCLLSEWAKKSQQIESVGAPEPAKHGIDDPSQADRDRITRVLVGSIDGQELRFPLFKDRLTIGRTGQNDIQLKASHISRRHAVIVTEGSVTRVIDWGSKNGVFVNFNRVTEHFLKNGDVVTVGTAEFRYEERPKRDA